METEFIYEADLNGFAPTTSADGVIVQVPVTIGGETQQHEVTSGEEIQVQTEVVESQLITDGETTEIDVVASAVAGIPVSTSELQLQDGQIITETTVTSDSAGEIIVGISAAAADAEVGALLTADQIPIMAAGSHIVQPDVEISPEDELRSNERLDRSSPDLWPQNLSSAAHHILAKSSIKTVESDPSLGIWAQGLDPEDINLLHQFGSLTSSSLVEEVKKLQNIAYQLGLEESKEMTRGKLLHVLDEEETTSKASNINQICRSLWQ